MECVTLTYPDQSEVTAQTGRLVKSGTSIHIDDDESLELAGSYLVKCKTVMKQIDAIFDEPVKAAHQAHKAMLAAKKKLMSPLQKVETHLKRGISLYRARQEEERRRREAEMRAAARAKEEERRLAEAARLESEGRDNEAQMVLDMPVHAPPVVLPPAVPKLDNVSTRENWTFRVVNEALIPREFLIPDTTKLRAHARSFRDKALVPGVEFFAEEVISARTSY